MRQRQGLDSAGREGDGPVKEEGAHAGQRITKGLGETSDIDAPCRPETLDEPVKGDRTDNGQSLMVPGHALQGAGRVPKKRDRFLSPSELDANKATP
ncbi:hypothetical protein BDI01nite_25410 [Brevundimonas diminuta]|nr:hypothetical protein BDI01nite_25410 [Brevundimonas diminuta]